MNKFQCHHCQKPIHRTQSEISKNKSGRFFCSRSCSATINNSKPKRKRTHACKTCKTPILSGLTYCEKCYPEKHYLSGKTLEEAIKNRKDSNRYTGIRGNARLIYAKSNKPKSCAVCSYKKHIEICHIKDICDFPTNTLISVINNLENLIALCPNHHWEFDHGLILT